MTPHSMAKPAKPATKNLVETNLDMFEPGEGKRLVASYPDYLLAIHKQAKGKGLGRGKWKQKEAAT